MQSSISPGHRQTSARPCQHHMDRS